jgi:tellurite resistance protein TerC
MIYFHELYEWVPKISTNFSLIVIASILVIATVASLLKSKKDPTAKAHAGRLTDSHDDSRS